MLCQELQVPDLIPFCIDKGTLLISRIELHISRDIDSRDIVAYVAG